MRRLPGSAGLTGLNARPQPDNASAAEYWDGEYPAGAGTGSASFPRAVPAHSSLQGAAESRMNSGSEISAELRVIRTDISSKCPVAENRETSGMDH